MNSGGIVQLQLIYLLLIIVIAIMKKSGVEKTRLLVVASVKMTVQLVIAGLVLSYIFQNPNPVFVVVYLAVMIGFAVHRVLSANPGLNRRFQIIIAASIALSGVFVLASSARWWAKTSSTPSTPFRWRACSSATP